MPADGAGWIPNLEGAALLAEQRWRNNLNQLIQLNEAFVPPRRAPAPAPLEEEEIGGMDINQILADMVPAEKKKRLYLKPLVFFEIRDCDCKTILDCEFYGEDANKCITLN